MIIQANKTKHPNSVIATAVVDALAATNPTVAQQRIFYLETVKLIIKPELFYLNIDGNKKVTSLIGICAANESLLVNDLTPAKQQLSFFQGIFMLKFMKDVFSSKYPKHLIDHETGVIALVVNNPRAYKKDSLYFLIKEVLNQTPFKHVLVETPSTNSDGIETYESLGFKEVYRQRNPKPKLGFSSFVYFRYTKPDQTE